MRGYEVYVVVLSNEDRYIIIDMSTLERNALIEIINGLPDDCYLAIDKQHAESIVEIKTAEHLWDKRLKRSSNQLKSRTARNQNKIKTIFNWFK